MTESEATGTGVELFLFDVGLSDNKIDSGTFICAGKR
jgi:hypothetical protein